MNNEHKKVAVIISPNYKDYAKKYLAECLDSIRKQDYSGEMKLYLTDNESTPESLALLKELAPEVEIVANKGNDGFAKGNNDPMKLALAAGFDYVILFNMDTVVAPDCVREMVASASSARGEAEFNPPNPPLEGRQIGAVQARLMLYDKKEIINSVGNVTHFLGFGYAGGYGEEYKSPSPPLLKGADTCYPSGAAVLFTAEALKKVGLFDEEFWMYNEDQDLGWRLWLAGYQCVLAGDAVVCHKYEFSRSIKKYYWMDRNRLIVMLKNYHWATLLAIAPAWLVMEIGLIFFSLTGGWFREKIRVYQYFFSLKNCRYILAARRQTQSLRQVNDREIVRLFSGKIWYQEIGEWRLKVANAVFDVYWRVVRGLIRW